MLNLFKPKKDPAAVPLPSAADTAAAGTAVPPPSSANAAAPAGPVAPSSRLVSVVGSLFRTVLSAELSTGVYRLEAGQLALFGEAVAACGRYDALFDLLLARVVPEQAEEFGALFLRKALYSRFQSGLTSAAGTFCFNWTAPPQSSAAAPDGETAPLNLQWFQCEALAISRTAGGAVRCLLFLRPVQSGADDGRALPTAPHPEGEAGSAEWERLRAQKLLGGRRTLFFEYAPGADTLTLHRLAGDPRRDRVVPHYLAGLSERCDWTVFHEDVSEVRRLFRSTAPATAEIRYRMDGDYAQPFHWHRMQCAPLEDTGTPTLLLGAVTDIDDEMRLQTANHDMAVQMGALIESTYAQIYELDTARGTIARITNNDGTYQRETPPRQLRALLEADLKSGTIAECSAADYESWLKPGHLETYTAAGRPLVFEGCQRRPGSLEYRWYAETVTCPDPKNAPHRFLRLCRDVTTIRQERQRNLELQERARYLEYNQAMLDTLATVVEFRDVESGQHIRRVRELSILLLEDLSTRRREYAMTAEQIRAIGVAATMHDVGKIAIPDSILNKPARFTPEEFEVMKTHTVRGADIIDRLELSQSAELKSLCRDIALHHHERYDGRGYPEGLVGDANSLAAQVVGMVDAYDALVSERCYKKAYTHAEAVRMLTDGECGAFSPDLSAALITCADKLHRRYLDIQ